MLEFGERLDENLKESLRRYEEVDSRRSEVTERFVKARNALIDAIKMDGRIVMGLADKQKIQKCLDEFFSVGDESLTAFGESSNAFARATSPFSINYSDEDDSSESGG